jgi:hypothetical protein
MDGHIQGPGPYKGSEAHTHELTVARHGASAVRISAGSSHNCDGKFLNHRQDPCSNSARNLDPSYKNFFYSIQVSSWTASVV